MNALLLVSAVPGVQGLIGILVCVAVFVLVSWGVIALVKCSGIQIPQPVWIVLTVFIGIALILLIAKAFGILTM